MKQKNNFYSFLLIWESSAHMELQLLHQYLFKIFQILFIYSKYYSNSKVWFSNINDITNSVVSSSFSDTVFTFKFLSKIFASVSKVFVQEINWLEYLVRFWKFDFCHVELLCFHLYRFSNHFKNPKRFCSKLLYSQLFAFCARLLEYFLGERSEAYSRKDTSEWFLFFPSVTTLCVSSLQM